MKELENRIGLLRLLLADIEGKRSQLAMMEAQYRAQLNRIVEFVVYREGDTGNALALMSEVQGKLNEVMVTAGHLGMIEQKAQSELEVLVLTKRVSEARSQLAQLQERQQDLAARLEAMSGAPEPRAQAAEAAPPDLEELRAIYDNVQGEIARLNDLITDASERAAKTVQEQTQQNP